MLLWREYYFGRHPKPSVSISWDCFRFSVSHTCHSSECMGTLRPLVMYFHMSQKLIYMLLITVPAQPSKGWQMYPHISHIRINIFGCPEKAKCSVTPTHTHTFTLIRHTQKRTHSSKGTEKNMYKSLTLVVSGTLKLWRIK